MKNNIIIIISILFSVFSGHGQTYVQGNGVLPFRSIANTSVLTDNNRLKINDAFQKYNEYGVNVSNKTNASQLVGEYYFKDNLLIQFISVDRDKNIQDEESLEERIDSYREMYTENIYENEAYFVGEILIKNNFKGIVYYDKRGKYINFSIRDNTGKYNVIGNVIFKPNNLNNARVFFDNFINSVTFK
ncbi:hypothetical protein J5U18_09850 [Sphingobacteriaceae bacterium WQ 2009]|uniref:Uncharacterized protein n=1 Tax=Rhinopithecimicrobium faecis TaxID=2820698 RepID=A0A8T4HC85_9SPHI|nr:hypothetical protein [Sphingobacteriaceae bacterium WQ 2009]